MFSRCAPLVVWAALLLSGCERKPVESAAAPSSAPAPVAAPATPPTSSDIVPATPAEPADSSLAIKRGVITGGEHPVFQACDDPAELWLVDETDGALAPLLTEGVKGLYAEVYGERGPIPAGVPAAQAYKGAFVLEQVLYTGNAAEIKGCAAPAPDYVAAARGNEPSWAAEVTDTQMVWKQPGTPTGITLGSLQSQDAEGTVSYHATGSEHELELMIDAQPCRDSMSGEFFGFAARARFDGKEFKGCARVGK